MKYLLVGIGKGTYGDSGTPLTEANLFEVEKREDLVFDENAVHYNAPDEKSGTQKAQARANIGSTSSAPQIIATAGAINNLSRTSNHLVFTGASVVLSGITGGLDGEEITILNASGTTLSILSESSLSNAENRFGSALTLPNLSVLRIKYRSITNRWILENVNINDARYVRKDVADTKTGDLTINGGSLVLASGTNGFLTWIPAGGLSGNGGGAIRFGEAGVEALRFGRDNVSGAGFGTPQFSRPCYFYERVDFRNGGLFGTNTAQISTSTGRVWHARSGADNESIRRDEQLLLYPVTVTTAGTINDLPETAGSFNYYLTAATQVNGAAGGENGKVRVIQNNNTVDCILAHENAGSIAANRINLIGGADLTIPEGGIIELIYHGTTSRWRLKSKNF